MLFGKHPFTVVPNGIDTARFAARDPQRRALLRGELGVADNEILFGHVGRFSAQKNHPGLLKIFAAVRARLPKARLVLLGGGAALYYVKFMKPKQSVKGGTDLDEFDFDEYDEDEPEEEADSADTEQEDEEA